MKTARARTIFSALAVALVSTAFAMAQGPGGDMGPGFAEHRPPVERAFGGPGDHGRWWNEPRMIERLKLTDDQRKAMDQIMFQHSEKLVDLRANLEKAEIAMEPLMSADQPDQHAMEAQIDKIVSARSELERANARFLLDIRMKLTPEQWKSLRTMQMHGRGEHPAPGQERMWRHRPGGPGKGPGAGPGNPPPPDQPPAQEPPAQEQGPSGDAQ